ncbi:MAG: response regulator [Bdellovibrionota bacterium]|nr:MAG: response regulator [Bdellovibrionota bacterium]
MSPGTSSAYFPASEIPASTEVPRSLNPERWRDLHEGKRILIVDDNPDTARLLQQALTPLYGTVDLETTPQQVLRRVRDAQLQGRPYDCIVTDLYMPGKSGIELIRELAAAESLPAIVLHTASMMSPTVARISAQIDRYRSGQALALAAGMLDAATQPGGQDLSFLVHFKLDGLSGLIDKIDAAQLLHQVAGAQTRRFWSTFEPSLAPTHFSAEAVHNFCEHARNFAAEMGALWQGLIADISLQPAKATEERAALHDRIAKAIDGLARCTFTQMLDDSSAAVANSLHRALYTMATLNPAYLPPADRAALPAAALQAWRELYERYRPKLQSVYDDFLSYHAPECDFVAICQREFGALGFRGLSQTKLDQEAAPPLHDPTRSIRSLMPVLGQSLRALTPTTWRNLLIDLSYVAESDRRFESPDHRALLDQINCGDYFALSFSFDYPGADLSSSLAEALPLLSREMMQGRLRMRQSSWLNGETRRWQVLLYIKANEKSIDQERFIRHAAQLSAELTRTIICEGTEFVVQEGLGRDKNVILIGEALTERMRPARGVIVHAGGQVLVSTGASHLDACGQLSQYLQALKAYDPEAVLLKTPLPDEATELYRICQRFNISYARADLESTEPEGANIAGLHALVDLGIAEERIRLSGAGFAERQL